MTQQKKRGRPPKKVTRTERITVRFTEDELKKIEDYCKKNNIENKADFLRNATMEKIKSGGMVNE